MSDPPPPQQLRWQELNVATGAVQLHVRRVVQPVATPMLLLHGLGVGGVVWQSFARRLLPDYAAVAPDLRGHGQSHAPPEGYAPADYARDLALLLTAPELNLHVPLPVLGHSLGALVGLTLAARRPDLVTALVLVDPPLDAALDRTRQDVAAVERLRHAPPGELEAYLLAANPGGGPLLARVLADLFRQAADAAFAELREQPPGFPAAWEIARQVARPVLVVHGDPAHGAALGAEAAKRFAASLPRGQVLAIPDAPHAIHASHPAQLATAVRQFLTAS